MSKILSAHLKPTTGKRPASSETKKANKWPLIDDALRRKFFLTHFFRILIPSLVPLLLLGTLSIFMADRYIRKGIESNDVNVLDQLNRLIEVIPAEIDSLALSFDKDPKITNKLKSILSADAFSYDDLEALYYLKNVIDVPANSRPYVHSIHIYHENDRNMFLSSREGLVKLGSYPDRFWLDFYERHRVEGEQMLTGMRDIRSYAFEKQKIRVVSVYKPFEHHNGNSKGMILINILPQYFEKSFAFFDDVSNRRLLVTDRRGQILMSSGHGLSVADTAKWRLPPNADLLQFTDRNYHVTIKRVPRLEWNLISAVPVHTLYKLPRTLIALTIVLSVCSMLISAFLAYRTTKKNYLQALRIVRILDTADNLNPAVHGSGTSGEIRNVYDLISKNILEKFLEQKYLKIQLSERKYKEEAAQLKALQSQINPHFLYNTLNSIYWKSFQLTRSENAACRMVEHLTDLLEYAVRDPEGTVSLEEELANVDSYIALQRHRYPERFRVIRDDPGDYAACRVMKISLQPLVENGLQYGLETRSFLKIKIRIRMNRNELKVTVIDNGPGMSREHLENIRHSLNAEKEESQHVGLYNTRKRLRLQFGSTADMRILSKAGVGTAVTLCFPQHHYS